MPEATISQSPRRALRLGIAQVHPRAADVQHNLAPLEEYAERAMAQDVDLLVTPELALTGYPVRAWFSSASIGVGES